MEVGSGTGAVLESLLEEGDFYLAGIDIDRSGLRFAQDLMKSFLLAQANGYKLPFPDDNFSISYCHYLLLWVINPDRILAEMQRVTRKGGCVIALAEPDYQSRIDFPPPLDQLGRHQSQSLQAQGADISIGRKLSALFNEAGLEDVEIGIIGARWKARATPEANKSEWMTIQSDLANQMPRETLKGYQDLDQSSWVKGNRVLFIPTFYAVGIVP